jgi:cardiolipin synthase (CMP-forming)
MNSQTAKPWGSLNWPNRISLLRLLLVAPFVVLVLNQQEISWARHAALGIFVVMAFSDFLDGMLARKLNLKTRLGALLDPLADKILIICSVVLLSMKDFSPRAGEVDFTLPNWVVVAVVGKDLWVVFGTIVVYFVTDRLRIQPTLPGKFATLVQLFTVIAVLLAPDIDRLTGSGKTVVLALSVLVVASAAAAMISYTRLGLSFIAKEQKPLEENHKTK